MNPQRKVSSTATSEVTNLTKVTNVTAPAPERNDG